MRTISPATAFLIIGGGIVFATVSPGKKATARPDLSQVFHNANITSEKDKQLVLHANALGHCNELEGKLLEACKTLSERPIPTTSP